MKIKGRIWKDGKFWVVECETLQANTQGKSRADGLEMMKDWVRSMLDDEAFDFGIEMVSEDEFEMSFSDSQPIVALVASRAT